MVENGWSNIKIEPETGVIKNNQSYRAEAYIKKLNLFFETKNFCYLRTKEAKAMSEFIEKLFSKEGNKGLYYEISPDFKVKVKQGPAKEGAMASCAINTKRLIDKMKRKMRDCDKKFKENQKVVLFFKLSDLTIQQIVMETYSRFINKSSSIIGIIIIRKINWGVGDPLKNHNVYIISKNKETEKILRKTFNKAVSH